MESAATDDELLERLQRAAFDYFPLYRNNENGLVGDTSLPGSPCSIAAVGFALSCYPVGVSRGWLARREAVEIVKTTLRFFDSSRQGPERDASGYKGFFYHFLDMKSGERVWNCELSFIDTAILMAGMLTAASFFDRADPGEREIRELALRIYSRVNWRWTENDHGFVRMGWKPESGFLRRSWMGYSEAGLMFVLGLASRTAPFTRQAYERWLDSCEWLEDEGVGGYLHSGALFTHLFPQAWLDLRGVQDRLTERHGIDYFENTRRAVEAQRNHTIRNPSGFTGYGENVWGLSACDGPKLRRTLRNGNRHWIAGYRARGVPFGPDDGTLVPWACLAALPFAPVEALASLAHMLTTYPRVLTEDRFVDSFNPSVPADGPEGWLALRCTGLDQGLLVMMIENHRTELIWKLTGSSAIFRSGLANAGFRDC